MRQSITKRTSTLERGVFAAALLAVMLVSGNANGQGIGCSAAASASNLACDFAAKDDLFTARAICMDSPEDDLAACLEDAQLEFEDVLDECGEIFESQREYCDISDDAARLPETVDGYEMAVAVACNAECLVTRDFSPLNPEANENKYYAPDVGMILEVNLDTGDRVELISYSVVP